MDIVGWALLCSARQSSAKVICICRRCLTIALRILLDSLRQPPIDHGYPMLVGRMCAQHFWNFCAAHLRDPLHSLPEPNSRPGVVARLRHHHQSDVISFALLLPAHR